MNNLCRASSLPAPFTRVLDRAPRSFHLSYSSLGCTATALQAHVHTSINSTPSLRQRNSKLLTVSGTMLVGVPRSSWQFSIRQTFEKQHVLFSALFYRTSKISPFLLLPFSSNDNPKTNTQTLRDLCKTDACHHTEIRRTTLSFPTLLP